MTKITRRGIPVLGINVLIISSDREICERFSAKPPLASKIYSCINDAAVINEMINLYKPKAIYFIFSKSERAGKNCFSAVSEYVALYNVRVGIVGSDAQYKAVKRVYGGEVSRLGLPLIRRDIAKARNIHSEHAAALAKRLKHISDGGEPLVAVFGCGLGSYAGCENIFDTYFSAHGIRLRTVYVNLLTASVHRIREKLISPDLMVIPIQSDEKVNKKIEAVLKSAAYKSVPYMTYYGDSPMKLALPESNADKDRLEVARSISRITVKK